MDNPEVLRHALKRPQMFLRSVTYDSIVAFITGYEVATQGSAILGFREWLLPQTSGERISLVWSQLFLWHKFPNEPDKAALLESPERNKEACELLCATLEDFWNLRAESEGLRIIYHRYEKWLRKKRICKPGDPLWIDGK